MNITSVPTFCCDEMVVSIILWAVVEFHVREKNSAADICGQICCVYGASSVRMWVKCVSLISHTAVSRKTKG